MRSATADGGPSSLPRRAGEVLRQPPLWATFAAALELTGARGRRAALRDAARSAAAGLIHLPIKRAIRRPRPRGAGSKWICPKR
jgi:hypothetical protein